MFDEQRVWQHEYSIASDTTACRQVLDEILGQLEGFLWDPQDVFSIHLAVEEALVNAIVHGNGSDPGKRVQVACWISPEWFRIQVTDEGAGFDPRQVPDPTDPDCVERPCGRGVMLMRAFMSCLRYSPSGNSVTMEKGRCCP